MSESDSGQEKSEQPTAKRLREAREKGQVARSREFNTLMVLLTGSAYLLWFNKNIGQQLIEFMHEALNVNRAMIFDPRLALIQLRDQIIHAGLLLAPLFGILIIVAIMAPVLIGGVNFSSDGFAFKFEKLNPLQGLQRIFSVHSLLELAKALMKFLLISIVAIMVLQGFWDPLLNLSDQTIENGIFATANMAIQTFLILSAALLLTAALDIPLQLWTYYKQLRMTKQEIRDEFKETDGKPEVKTRIRQLQIEQARRRMMAEVPKADVVITNPTHYAVALAYKAAQMRAPRLLAKGIDTVALAIRKSAQEHKITLVEAPQVARAIYYTTELNQEIPGGLFVAVARILAYVYQLKHDAPDVTLPNDLPVPAEYLDLRSARRARNRNIYK